MKVLTTSMCAALVLGLCGGVPATVIHVPDDYMNIQWGIDAAVDGDTVLVADGTYTGSFNRDLDFGGKAILVMSENGPHATTLDCGGSASEPHRGFYFHSAEGPSSVVRGFTIRGGWADCGGGLGCESSSPRIEGNVITWNTAGQEGGGIYCEDASPTIIGNTILRNTADMGGGIACHYYSSPAVVNSILRDGSAPMGLEISLVESSTMTFSYSDIQMRAAMVHVAPGCTLYWGEGIITSDPDFVCADMEDYRLLWGSPCIDAGDPDPACNDPDGTRGDIGGHFFDQSKELVTYMTLQALALHRGDICPVLYTLINCHPDPQPVRGVAILTLPNGNPWAGNPLEGPGYQTMPGEYTFQCVREYYVPQTWPLGTSVLLWKVGLPRTLYDQDSAELTVVEP